MNARRIAETLRRRSGRLTIAIGASALLAVAALTGVSLASAAPGGPPDDSQAIAQAQAREQARREQRATPAAKADRANSASAYHGLADASAIALDRDKAQGVLAGALDLIPGRLVALGSDPHTARVDTGSGPTGTLVDSTLPLRTPDGKPVDLSLTDAGDGFAAQAPLAPVRIANAASGGATLTNSGVGLVPLGASAVGGRVVGGAVAWPNAFEDTDLAARPTATGFETFAVLRSSASPEDYRYRLALPAGATPVKDASDDGIQIVSGGQVVAAITPGFASDADGFPVAVTESLVGDVLTLHVAHQGADALYPITLDPSINDTYDFRSGNSSWGSWVFGLGQGNNGAFSPFQGCAYLGCGNYIRDNVGAANYNGNDASYFRYTVAGNGSEAYITSMSTNGYLDELASANMCFVWEIDPGNGPVIDCGGPGSKSATPTSGGGSQALWEVWAGSSGARTYTGYQGYAQVAITDNTAPTLVSTNAPASWTSNTAAPISASYSDGGLGIQSARLWDPSFGGWSGGQNYNASCTSQPPVCPAAASVNGTVANLPQGSNAVSASATDRVGNVRTTNFTVKVDNTAPTQAISGDAWNPPGGALTPGSHSITVAASDGYSGLKQIELKIDAGTGPGGDQISTNPSCTSGGCPTTYSHTFTFDTSQYAPGPHTISVTSSDAVSPSAFTKSDQEAVTFANGNLPAVPGRCDGTGETDLAKGYDAGTYVALQTRQSGSQTLVCVQVANGTTINKDAVFMIDTGSVAAPVPTYDSSSGACSTATPNDVPGLHPEFDVTVLGTQRIMLDAYSAAGQAWICVQVGSLQYRVMVTAPGLGTTPQVSVGQDNPPVAPPPLTPWPAGPSATCTAGGGTMLEDGAYGPESLWLADYQPNATTLDLCLKAQGPISLGGLLSVNASPSDGVHLVLQQGTSMADCGSPGQPLIDLDSPTRLHVHMSAAGTQPATICIDNGTVRTFTIGVTGSGAPTVVTWTPDVGTPIPPVGI